jgi:hypothetical protein
MQIEKNTLTLLALLALLAPLCGTSLREDGLHEAKAAEPNKPTNTSEHNHNTNCNNELLAPCNC